MEGSAKRRIGVPRLGTINTAGVLGNSHRFYPLPVYLFGFLKISRCAIYLGFTASCQYNSTPSGGGGREKANATWHLEGPADAGTSVGERSGVWVRKWEKEVDRSSPGNARNTCNDRNARARLAPLCESREWLVSGSAAEFADPA